MVDSAKKNFSESAEMTLGEASAVETVGECVPTKMLFDFMSLRLSLKNYVLLCYSYSCYFCVSA